ncbi:PAS domain-containing hybrid sensor histidine kinase/response regulator [Dyadobacter sp. CY323]|uniref:PAS domain-containing hybrid sensor histidine kinase/response regulator n=1 Tax=Dyadobacter sp. CY323 TaxID=2907302 RepID=UPI001F1C1585|nr:PAS domain-containing hybrid sensor histidine kinase/response regulator [Dyadobacter sp. CY323]MCE6987727.1 PAS domain S-box protein [Dyadobacter sp. CY323]
MNNLRKALFKLMRNEAVFDFVQDHAVDGLLIWQHSDSGSYWADNKLLAAISILNPESEPGSLADLLATEQFARYRQRTVTHFQQSTSDWKGELRIESNTGKFIRFRLQSIAVFDTDLAEALIITGFIKHNQEAPVPESPTNTQLYSLLSNATSIYVVGIDTDGNYLHANDSYCNFYGVSRDEIIGTSSLVGIVPEDIDKCRIVGNQCLVRPGMPHSTKIRKQTFSDGVKTTRWEFTGIADETGTVRELFCVGYDITRQTMVEGDLSVLVSNMQDVLFTISREGVFTYISPSWTSVYGYSLAETLGQSFTQFIHPEDIEVCSEALRVTVETGQPVSGGVEHRIRHKNGNWSWSNTAANIDPGSGRIILTSHDITELRNSREKLKELAFVASNTTDYIVITDSLGRITWVNTAFESRTGYNLEEIKGRDRAGLLKGPETDHETVERIYQNFKLLKILQEEILCYTRTGEQYWIDLKITPVFDDSGACINFIAVERDITARKKSEDQLKRITDILEQTNRVARIGGWELNLKTKGLYWSSITKELHEFDQDEEPVLEEAILFYKEGPSRDTVRRVVREGIANGTSWDHELQIVTAKGNELWVRTIGKPEMKDGVCVRIYGAFQDITRRKKAEVEILNSEAKFRGLYNSTSDAVILFDKDRFLDCNIAALKMFGIESPEHLREMSLGTLSGVQNADEHAESLQLIRDNIQFAYDKGSHSVEWVFKRFGEDAEPFIAEVLLTQISVNDQTIIQAVVRDITIRKRVETDLHEARKHAEAASKMKSEFLANMSHEIRTPLNGVVGFTDLLMKTNLDETQQQYMSMVFQSANSLLDIISDILDFSKIEAGKLELTFDKTDLLEVCGQVADMVAYQAQQKHLEMLLNIPAEIPHFVWADSLRLRQILVNLLSNAVKFTLKGEIELRIELVKKVNDLDNSFRFSVRDTGIGIDPQHQRRIFEAFAQEDSSTTKRYGGTGLGLTISNSLLGLMGSKLELRSSPEKGSTFFFDVTFTAVQGKDLFEWENVHGIKRILIVDDSENNGHILADMLDNKDISSDFVQSGDQALECITSGEEYDVILMDCHMPEMGGVETIKKIREQPDEKFRKQPIILLNDTFEDEMLTILRDELGIQHFLLKPVKIQQLFYTLSNLGKNEITPLRLEKEHLMEQKKFGLGKVTVLIAEDHKINMILVKSMLIKILPDVTMVEAASGLEAIEQFRKSNPDIVFMDIQMPEMNGYEATKGIRMLETESHVPIIALTAGTVVGEREKCLEAGMDDYLTKPVVKDTLELAIQKWLVNV